MYSLRLLAVLSSSALLWASFFRGGEWLVWVALVPLFWALSAEGRRGRGAVLGAAFGSLFSLLEFWGLLELKVVLGLPIALLALSGMVAWGAIWGGILGALGTRGTALGLAGLWVGMEVLRASGPWGVAVGTVPVAFVGLPFLRAAATVGPWALSLAASLTNAFLAAALKGKGKKAVLLASLPPLFLAALLPFAGTPAAEGELRVALVQPGLDLPERLEISTEELLQRYGELFARIPPGIDLILLPEDAVPRVLSTVPKLQGFFRAQAARLGASVFVGGWSITDGNYYNSVFLFRPSGEWELVHRKVRLLPFGEYVPLRPLWERLGLQEILARFLPREVTPGEEFAPAGIYGVVICSETMFPGISRVLVHKGAQVLLALTNDSWFGKSRLLWEHFACVALRAAEVGRAFLQAALTGMSGGFSPDGTPLGILPLGKRGTRTLRVPLYSHTTPYQRLGDGPVLGISLFLFLTPFIGLAQPPWRRRSARKGRSP